MCSLHFGSMHSTARMLRQLSVRLASCLMFYRSVFQNVYRDCTVQTARKSADAQTTPRATRRTEDVAVRLVGEVANAIRVSHYLAIPVIFTA